MSKRAKLAAASVVAALAVLAASAGQAATRPDDRAGPLGIGTQEVAAVPDVIERTAAAHPYGRGLSAPLVAAAVARPPDVSDAAEAARAISSTDLGGFNWSDYGAGVGTGIGAVALLVGCCLVWLLVRRPRTQAA